MNSVFANRSKEEEIYPLTVKEIAEAQGLDKLFTKAQQTLQGDHTKREV